MFRLTIFSDQSGVYAWNDYEKYSDAAKFASKIRSHYIIDRLLP